MSYQKPEALNLRRVNRDQVRVFPQIRSPMMVIPFSPLVKCLASVEFENLLVASIDSKKVSDNAIIVEFPLACQDACKTEMLYMVTPLTESDKTLERLNMFFVVILPYLMAVQARLLQCCKKSARV